MDRCSYDESLGIYINSSSRYLDYADGSEAYIGQVFRNTESLDAYAVDLQKQIKDWPSRYHLSYLRTNLPEAVAEVFDPRWEVLEIGAGNGALTPWFSEHFRKVDAIEGSLERAKNIRLRMRKASNVRVFAGDVTTMSLSGKYGLVSVVGVLEYIPYYDPLQKPEDACMGFLEKLGTALTDDGVMLLAIENKLGAKYLAGCGEDHNGRLFSGIMDYPDRSPLTFSRNELEALLKGAGFTKMQFYHLFPDYKLPTTVIRETPYISDLPVSGLVRGLFEDRSGGREFCFHDTLFLHSLAKAGLVNHFSNSFLVLCSKNPSANLQTGYLCRKFWNREGTRPVFHHTISLGQDESGYKVSRDPMKTGVRSGIFGDVEFRLPSEQAFVQGESMMVEAYKAALSENSEGRIAGLLLGVMDDLKRLFSVGTKDPGGYDLLLGESIDYCVWNLVKDEKGATCFIDRKWKFAKPVSIDFVLFRSLYYVFQDVYPFVKASRLSGFVLPAMQRVFPGFGQERFDECLRKESGFQACTSIGPVAVSDIEVGDSAKTPLSNLKAQLLQREQYISEITSGRGWRVLSAYYRAKARFASMAGMGKKNR